MTSCREWSLGNGKIFDTRRKGWCVSSWLHSDPGAPNEDEENEVEDADSDQEETVISCAVKLREVFENMTWDLLKDGISFGQGGIYFQVLLKEKSSVVISTRDRVRILICNQCRTLVPSSTLHPFWHLEFVIPNLWIWHDGYDITRKMDGNKGGV